MTSHEQYDRQRLAGAAVLLASFPTGLVPEDPAERNALLEPTLRALWDSKGRGGRTLYEVAAQLRTAAEVLEADRELPIRGVRATPEQLRVVAEHVIGWDVGRSQRLVDATPTSAELAFRFPQLLNMLVIYYGQDGIAVEAYPEDPRQSLHVVIDDWHPRCASRMPPLAAECQEALTLFQTEEALERFFVREHHGDSAGLPWLEWLPLIIDVLGEHMRAHHPPKWVHKSS